MNLMPTLQPMLSNQSRVFPSNAGVFPGRPCMKCNKENGVSILDLNIEWRSGISTTDLITQVLNLPRNRTFTHDDCVCRKCFSFFDKKDRILSRINKLRPLVPKDAKDSQDADIVLDAVHKLKTLPLGTELRLNSSLSLSALPPRAHRNHPYGKNSEEYSRVAAYANHSCGISTTPPCARPHLSNITNKSGASLSHTYRGIWLPQEEMFPIPKLQASASASTDTQVLNLSLKKELHNKEGTPSNNFLSSNSSPGLPNSSSGSHLNKLTSPLSLHDVHAPESESSDSSSSSFGSPSRSDTESPGVAALPAFDATSLLEFQRHLLIYHLCCSQNLSDEVQMFTDSSMWLGNNSKEGEQQHSGTVDSGSDEDDNEVIEPMSEDVTAATLSKPHAVSDRIARQELKNTGQSYINTKGKVVEARNISPQDCSKCQFRCNESLSEAERKIVFNEYWGLADYNKQREYLAAHMQRVEKVGRSGQPRTVVLYSLTHKDERIQVCRKFFLSTLDISEKTSRITLDKKNQGCFGNLEVPPAKKQPPPKKVTTSRSKRKIQSRQDSDYEY